MSAIPSHPDGVARAGRGLGQRLRVLFRVGRVTGATSETRGRAATSAPGNRTEDSFTPAELASAHVAPRTPSEPSPYLTEAGVRDRTFASKTVFGDPDFWAAMEQVPDERLEQTLRYWYPSLQKRSRPLREVQGLGGRHLPLLLDPGIACRVDEFVAFARGWLARHPGARPFELRGAFAQSLGTVDLYRAVSIPFEEAEPLRSLPAEERVERAVGQGYQLPPSLLPARRELSARTMDGLFGQLRSQPPPPYKLPSINLLIDWHMEGDSDGSLLASYSHYPEVAHGVARARTRDDDDTLLLKLRFPALSIVQTTGLLAGQGISRRRRKLEVCVKNQAHTFRTTDPRVEVFTFLAPDGVVTGAEVVDSPYSSFRFHR